jgi:nucleoside-diphosphate-sugar epimerase
VTVSNPILVTGSAGFIGQALVAALLGRGDRVRVFVRRPEAARSLAALGAEAIVGDMLDPSAVKRAANGVAGVFHLAGRLFDPGSTALDYARLHVDATMSLLDACSVTPDRAPGYVVLCSTTGVHGPTAGVPAREDDSGRPQNAYEATKAEAELRARAIAARRQLPLVIARPGLVYGPGDRHLLGWFRAIQSGYYRVIGTGRNHLHPIYIDDAIRALLCCPAAANPEGRAFHLVGSHPVTMRDLSDAIGRAVGRRVPRAHLPASLAYAIGTTFELLPVPRRWLPLTRTRVRFMLQNREYDGSRATAELGFAPTVDLDAGLTRTVAWYRQERLL